MRKNQIKHLFLKFIVFVGLAFLIFSCEQDNIVNETQNESIHKNQKAPTIRTFSQDNIGERFNDIAQQLNIRKYLKKSKDLIYASRTSYDTLGVTIYTDEIKEVTIDDYTSYTMRMATPETDSTSFYNVTIEDDNGVTEMYVIKYTPEETWLDNKDQPYEGNITTVRVNNFTHILPDDQGGGAGEDYGDLGYNFTEPQGSPYYPTDCNGIVYVTMESIPYQCSCEDHWPNQTCYCGINGNPGYQPGFNEVPYYYCDENSDTIDDSEQSGNTNTDTTTGGTTTTGSGNNSNPDNNLITVLLNPDEECEAPEGDLNGDCILDNYEVCLLNGYNQDVCDCVALGNQLSNCVDDDEIYIGMDKECQLNQIQNFTTNTDNSIVEFIRNTFVGNDDFNLLFEDIDLSSSIDGNAHTILPDNLDFNENTVARIIFDNDYLDNATDLSIVMSTTHEYIHVWLAYLYSQGTLLNNYPTYTSLNSAFQAFQNDSSLINAENLANEMHNVYDDFLNMMIDAVFNYASDNNISDADYEYCEKLVIGAHQNTNTFQNLTVEEQNEYSTITVNEEQGNTNAYGNNCE